MHWMSWQPPPALHSCDLVLKPPIYSLGGRVVVGPLFPPTGGAGVFLAAPGGGLAGGGLVCLGGLVLRGGVGLVGGGGGVQGVVATGTYLGGVVTDGLRLVTEMKLNK